MHNFGFRHYITKKYHYLYLFIFEETIIYILVFAKPRF